MENTNSNSQVPAVQSRPLSSVERFEIDNGRHLVRKNGRVCGVINRKDYGLMVSLKGAELKRAHNKLVLAFNSHFKPAAVAALSQDGVIVRRFEVSHAAAGTFITVKALMPAKELQTEKPVRGGGGARKAPSIESQLAGMSAEDKAKLLELLMA